MYQPKSPTFDAAQPLLPGVSPITIAEALTCEQLLVTSANAPSIEVSGETLLVSTDFRRVRNAHLEGDRIRFFEQPVGENGMLQRINWMWHAGSRSPDLENRNRAMDAIEVMLGQVAPDGQFDAQSLAEDLAMIEEDYPAITASLFTGDLDDVPDLIDAVVENGADEKEMVRAAAWMFVTWSALEQQREACHGHRLIHYPLDGVWGAVGSESWTMGQIFRPQTERHAFAHEMMGLYHGNLSLGVTKVEDKRTLNRIEKTLSRMDLGWINRTNKREILALFGQGRAASLPVRLAALASHADTYQQHYEAILTGPDGRNRAGRRADMLAARISAVHRTAIVCARTCHLAALAANAFYTDGLRAMLDAGFPDVLKRADDRKEDAAKFRLRQLFHVVRIEFLRDGEHLPKELKGSKDAGQIELPLELDEKDRRRGHEIFDLCRDQLNDQPSDWRFITPFGWQCDGAPRVRLTAPPAGAASRPSGFSPEVIEQFEIERGCEVTKRRAAFDRAPFAATCPDLDPLKRFETQA